MIDTLRSEWIKFRTVPMNVVLLAIGAGLPFIITLLTTLLIDAEDMDGADVLALAIGSSLITAMLLGVIAVAGVAGEFGFGTIRPTFAATPRRMRVVGAKVVLSVGVAAVVQFVLIAACFAIGSALINSRGGSAGWADTTGSREPIVGIVLFAAIVSLIGVGIGLLVRSTPGAVAILILWPLIAEGLIATLLLVARLDTVAEFLPFQAGNRLWFFDDESLGEDVVLGRWTGGLVFLVAAGVVVWLGALVTSKRDA